ncbi:hypothetical protein [Oceanimonas smirnovii]|uniref:hypothetical protein n=1 Tax=Oceanimonas smirnovii TaxID=264574 RepID=UPI00376FA521
MNKRQLAFLNYFKNNIEHQDENYQNDVCNGVCFILGESFFDYFMFFLENFSFPENNSIEIPGCRTPVLMHNSCYIKESNFLFCSIGHFDFVIVQYRNFCDGIITTSNLKFFGSSTSTVLSKVTIFKNLFIENKIYKKEKSKFKGFWASQKLPYHYFYDVLPAVYKVNSNVASKIDFSFIKGGAFLELEKKFNLKSYSEKELPPLYCEDLRISLLKPIFSKSIIGELDNFLVNKVLSLHGHNNILNPYKKKEKLFVWINIMEGKRSLANQIDIISSIIELIMSRTQKKPFFIFDGMTSSIENTSQENWSNDKHQTTIEKIINICNIHNQSINIHGKKSIDKIICACDVDIFFSDASTSSMYPARFAKKKGLAYGVHPKAYIYHIHPHSDFIFELENFSEVAGFWDRRDIYISKDKILDAFENTLRNL